MKKTERKSLREKSTEDLKKELGSARKDLAKMRLERQATKIKNVHTVSGKQRFIATILTLIGEREFLGELKEAEENQKVAK